MTIVHKLLLRNIRYPTIVNNKNNQYSFILLRCPTNRKHLSLMVREADNETRFFKKIFGLLKQDFYFFHFVECVHV